ncbi:L,D-transpeptidase family protein [Erwinia aphidicola]|mgnify:CR=1 FL=1|jgi:L,D-transpeptidase YbiS|uniref:L,D-transpeptidase family protein n=1 Tax=Erwinia aphidicola TaxID=68334 RepID=A0ABU8DAE7_ERWAP|nr:L,D-transpeptidase family protein [Erwinia aphidicola]KMV69755.1 L,D-transpeptidase [bacteria symbiont BFo1 of Frankliniella occidentalis]KYP83810.1 L,D-transpeptidase [bacteria symbiont BFo1 of Frankliniella occidentalis]KYP89188.1 L,D-transpeptidase [bacteria symbiont BFo1 of Frankliniella occidentalis]MBD1376551.1 L,D-transpeptidase family protein [Erwinia aphidicola]
MKKSIRAFVTLILAAAAFSQSAFAVVYPLPAANSRLTGENLEITIPEDSKLPLEAFAAQYQMGLSNIMEANPGVDVYLPKAGSKLIIPQQLILPDAPREGIVINSAEMRLYYYPKGSKTVVVLPIGIGELGKDTPINWTTTVQRKKDGPTWTPTKKMHEEYNARGESLPAVFPAGPDNPMGLYALYIGRLYAIHGTNANFGIGLRVSHGCVRLRADDIKWLFDHVPVGTRVQFIDQPIKATVEPDGSRYVEVHNPLSQTEEQFKSREPVPLTIPASVTKIVADASVNSTSMEDALKARSGMPVKVNGEATVTEPAVVPEQEGAQPMEQPMTPVTTEGANVADPAAPAAAPADAAAPAAADNGSAQAPADSATPVAAPAMPALTQPGPIYSQPKS